MLNVVIEGCSAGLNPALDLHWSLRIVVGIDDQRPYCRLGTQTSRGVTFVPSALNGAIQHQ